MDLQISKHYYITRVHILLERCKWINIEPSHDVHIPATPNDSTANISTHLSIPSRNTTTSYIFNNRVAPSNTIPTIQQVLYIDARRSPLLLPFVTKVLIAFMLANEVMDEEEIRELLFSSSADDDDISSVDLLVMDLMDISSLRVFFCVLLR